MKKLLLAHVTVLILLAVFSAEIKVNVNKCTAGLKYCWSKRKQKDKFWYDLGTALISKPISNSFYFIRCGSSHNFFYFKINLLITY